LVRKRNSLCFSLTRISWKFYTISKHLPENMEISPTCNCFPENCVHIYVLLCQMNLVTVKPILKHQTKGNDSNSQPSNSQTDNSQSVNGLSDQRNVQYRKFNHSPGKIWVPFSLYIPLRKKSECMFGKRMSVHPQEEKSLKWSEDPEWFKINRCIVERRSNLTM